MVMLDKDRWVDVPNARFIKDDRGTYDLKLIDQAKDLNANFILLSFTGTSGSRELWDWKLIQSFVQRCHIEGIKVSFYMKLTNINWKPMFSERPESKTWLMMSADGTPALYGGKTDRYMGCLANPEWREFLKGMVAEAVKYRPDALFYDNYFIPSSVGVTRDEGGSSGWACYCRFCRDQFMAYTSEFIGWPCDLPERPDWADPIWQKFIEFRDKILVEVTKEIADYAHEISPGIVVYPNVKPPFQGGGGTKGSATTALAGIVDVLLFERRGTSKLGVPIEGGEKRPLNVAIDWKYASALKDTPLWYRMNEPGTNASYTPEDVKIGMAEASSFGGAYHNIFSDVLLGEPLKAAAVKLHYDFLNQNSEHYIGVRPVADVAILVSGSTSNWYVPDMVSQTGELPESITSLAQALVELHIPFNVVLDGDVTAELDYKILVLPDVACMSGNQAKAITRFVRKGGALLATGLTSLYDERYRARADFKLSELFGVHHGQKVEGFVKNSYGAGRCGYLSSNVVNNFWRKGLPQDLSLIEESMMYLLSDLEPIIQVNGPSTTLVNLMKKNDESGTLIHLVNYERMRVADISVRLRRPLGRAVQEATVFSPGEKAIPLVVTDGEQSVAFTIPTLEVYDLVAVKWC